MDEFSIHSTNLDSIIESVFARCRLDRRDRRLAFEIVYGVMRYRLSLDYVLQHFLHEKRYTRNERLLHILRIGMYQIVYLDKIPDYAAVNESVQLAKDHRQTSHAAGIVNAVLRNIIKQKKRLPKPAPDAPLAERLSITYSHPQWLITRWLARYGLSNTKKLLEFNNRRPDVFLRRTVKGLTRQQFESDARTICDSAGGGRGYKNLYYRLNKQCMPENISLFKEGYCTVQAESSGWIVALLDIHQGEKLLDVCSAPGGKTSLMAELSGSRGAVCACDCRFDRMMKVRETLARMQLTNVFCVVGDGTQLPVTGKFDKVLLDVPCSGTGVMHRHPEARWIRKEKDIEQLLTLQRNLLESAASFIVPHGILVYATCSLEPEENYCQIEAFLKRHQDFVLERPVSPIHETFIDHNDCVCITPYEHAMDGMFAARMRKRTE